jgi:hypothetical protein
VREILVDKLRPDRFTAMSGRMAVLRDTLNRITATLANTFGLAVAPALDDE